MEEHSRQVEQNARRPRGKHMLGKFEKVRSQVRDAAEDGYSSSRVLQRQSQLEWGIDYREEVGGWLRGRGEVSLSDG